MQTSRATSPQNLAANSSPGKQNLAALSDAPSIEHDQPPESKQSSKPRKVYKPQLSVVIKRSLEDTVDDAQDAQTTMERMQERLEVARQKREVLRANLSLLAPLDHRMAGALTDLYDLALYIADQEHDILKLALIIRRMERRMTLTLTNSRRASPTPSGTKGGAQ